MKGYQKRVIYMKNTGSPLFEEAYFVISSDTRERESFSEAGMIEEANRIIKENSQNGKGGFIYRHRWHLLAFFIGAALSLFLCLLF